MKWGFLAAAVLLSAAPQAKEEKGRLKIFLRGQAAGEETFRFESFDDGRLVCFTRASYVSDKTEFFADTALSVDAKTLAPRLYAGVHRVAKSEVETRLEWKEGRVEARVRRAGKETTRELKGAPIALCDDDSLAPWTLVVRRFKEGKHKLKGLVPSTLSETDLVIEDGGSVDLKGEGRSVGAHRWTLSRGETRIDYFEDSRRLPLLIEIPSKSLSAVLEGFEDCALGRASGTPEGAVASDVTLASGKLTLAGSFTRPKSGDKFPALLLLSDTEDRSRSAELLKSVAAALVSAGFAVLRYDPRPAARARLSDHAADAAAALRWLRGRAEVDADRVALVGQGEGALLAASLARDERVRAVFLLAAPGRPYEELVLDRLERSLRASGTAEEARRAILEDERARLRAIREAASDTMVIDEKETFIGWMRERLRRTVAGELAKVPGTVVLFAGETDSGKEADLLEKAMKDGGKENAETVRLTGLDSYFSRTDAAPDAGFLKSLAERVSKYLK